MRVKTNIVANHVIKAVKDKTTILVEQGGSRCFVGETLVSTVKGHKKIKDVKIGDVVYSYDDKLKLITTNKVINKFIYEVEQPLLSIKLKDEEIICTPRHRFLFGGEWIPALELVFRGDKSKKTNTNDISFKGHQDKNFKEIDLSEIQEVKLFSSKEKVYDLEVENTHSYAITKDNIIVHNSGKTYNILVALIVLASTQWENKKIDIVRKSFPTLRTSVMTDFFDILYSMGVYDEKNHNKSIHEYSIGSNKFRFFSCDNGQKMRGPGRHILFCNEANELKLDEFRQLNMRCEELTILDYNPSDEFHWIYDQVLIRDDVIFNKTTYLDNPFLPERIIKEIEEYKKIDPNYWKIYGLGERGVSQTSIYTHWELVNKLPEGGNITWGLDFGYNHPVSLVKCVNIDDEFYFQEVIHEPHLTVADLIKKMEFLNVNKTDVIYGDCSRPEMIEEIHRAGYNVHGSKKGPNSVKDGIDILKRHKMFITKDSVNILKEIKSYKWMVDRQDRVLDEPVKINDDSMDAIRYSINYMLVPKQEFSVFEESLF